MTVEATFEIVFAAGVLATTVALAAAAFSHVRSRLLLVVSALLGAAAAAAWVVFALQPSAELAVAATGLLACLAGSLGAVGLRRGLAKSAALETDLERQRAELAAVVERELRQRAAELESTLARARADALSSYAVEERRYSDERRREAGESEEQARAALLEMLTGVERQVEQRLASWSADLERTQQGIARQVAELSRRQREAIAEAEARIASESERLETVEEEQRAAIARVREELTKMTHQAGLSAAAELESQAAERRRALHDVDERLRVRERELGQRIEREHAEAARRIEITFADIERRQVEQLERAVDRAKDRFADAAGQQFERAVKIAREEAAQRLSRELDRSVQMFAREGEAVLAERLSQLGDTGALRLEKKLNQVAAALERQREEFMATTERRLTDLEADFRDRLAGLAADEEAERGTLEARLQELSRRIDQALARAEERLASLRGLS
jgi:golgin subfamily B member 1